MSKRSTALKLPIVIFALLGLALSPKLPLVNADRPTTTTAPAGNVESKALMPGNPKTADDMIALQEQVQVVVKKVLPATVNIVSGNSQGSGVIVTKDGYILTAGHVCAEANKDVTIRLADGRSVKGKTLGINKDIDSGMMKITTEGEYPFVEIGKSSTLKVGQWIVTLGHPLGYRKDRPPVLRFGHVIGIYRNGVQIECTIVSGDSGGPSFDLDGKLVGIHSRISGGATNNIDVPVDTFNITWDRLAKAEVWGGGGGQTGTGAALGLSGSDDPAGCKVDGVQPNSAAEKAGLKAGDVITMIDEQKVEGIEALAKAVSKRKPGDKVKLEVQREDEKLEISATLMKR